MGSEVAKLEATLKRERRAARQRMARARREFEAQLTRMVQEIGHLRHHEARARVLVEQLAARDAQTRTGGKRRSSPS